MIYIFYHIFVVTLNQPVYETKEYIFIYIFSYIDICIPFNPGIENHKLLYHNFFFISFFALELSQILTLAFVDFTYLI